MKKLANLKGVKTLSKMQQKTINGGSGCNAWYEPECPNYDYSICECPK